MKPDAGMCLWVSHKPWIRVLPWKCNAISYNLSLKLLLSSITVYLCSQCYWKNAGTVQENKQNAAKFYFKFITTVHDQDLDKSTVHTSTLDTSLPHHFLKPTYTTTAINTTSALRILLQRKISSFIFFSTSAFTTVSTVLCIAPAHSSCTSISSLAMTPAESKLLNPWLMYPPLTKKSK